MATTEYKIVEEIINVLQKLVKKDKYIPKIKIDHHVNILKDITAMPNLNKKGKWELVFGHAEQDIVVYLDEESNEHPQEFGYKYKIEVPFGQGDIAKAKRSFPTKSKIKHFPFCIIPYVIWEVKYGDLNTHQIVLYSSISQQIKDKFPHVMYNLLVLGSGKTNQTLIRHGKNFDIMKIEKGKLNIERISEEIYEIIKERMKFNGILKSK